MVLFVQFGILLKYNSVLIYNCPLNCPGEIHHVLIPVSMFTVFFESNKPQGTDTIEFLSKDQSFIFSSLRIFTEKLLIHI